MSCSKRRSTAARPPVQRPWSELRPTRLGPLSRMGYINCTLGSPQGCAPTAITVDLCRGFELPEEGLGEDVIDGSVSDALDPLPAACGCRKLCRWWSGGISVLVDESATAGCSNDLEVSVWLVCSVGGDGWSLVERTVGPVRVVMIDVVDDKIVELAAVPDDGAVKGARVAGCRSSVRRTRSPRGCAQVS